MGMIVNERLRFFAKVSPHPATECWNWLGARTQAGYGIFTIKKRPIGAHQYAYRVFVGLVPDGFQIDHLCRNVSCCNPAHLEAVTPSVNRLRGSNVNTRKTACPRGHAYDARRKDGRRYCLVCDAAAHRRSYLKKKAI